MSVIEDRERSFATLVLGSLARRAAELTRVWADRAKLAATDGGKPACTAEEVVRAVLAASRNGDGKTGDIVARTGRAVGLDAHRRNVSLRQMLEELDLLQELLLHAAERTAATGGEGPGHEALGVARCISTALSSLRLAAVEEYATATADELRARYRTIRHDLRNPLGTIRSAVALLTDESAPPEMRDSAHIRAMVVRNARSLDQMIGQILGDDAARLSAFGALAEATASARQQRDDLARASQRLDLESGAL